MASYEIVKKYFKATEMIDTTVKIMRTLWANAIPEVPASIYDSFFTNGRVELLMNMIAPAYQDRFTEEEIKEMISFHESEVGQKVLSMKEELMDVSNKAAEMWFGSFKDQLDDEISRYRDGNGK